MTSNSRERQKTLRQRHTLQLAADDLFRRADAAAAGARQRRTAALQRLDVEVTSADRARDVALVGLLSLVRDEDLTAETAGVEVSELRAAVKRTDAAEVAELVAGLETSRGAKRRKVSVTVDPSGSPGMPAGSVDGDVIPV